MRAEASSLDMDIHRCRFVPYPVSTINALSFSHPSTPKESANELPNLRLALGRANGNIEIWNPQKGHWVHESTLRGGKERSVEGLAWTHDLEEEDQDGQKIPGKLRLFSVGYSTVITEWDLALGKPVRHSGGNYGEIWCMAVQPRWQPSKKPAAHSHDNKTYEQHIAVGCADGTVVLHSTADGDLQFLRTLARPSGKKSRVLSIAFLGRDRIVAGYADSTIRIYDIHTGRPISSMSLGAGTPGGPSEILVWSVKCLPSGNIVSGDSTGEVRFWDGKTFTLLQRIKSHKQDILALAVSADGSTVFSGGMDRRTTMYRQTGDSGRGRSPRWAEISHQRYHAHDIKVMSTFESKDLSIVASGGVDATPIIIPLREFGREYVRSLPAFPSSAPLQSAPKRRLLMSWWDREVRIWRIENLWTEPNDSQDEADAPQPRNLVARIVLKGEENIAAVSMSSNGSLLAVSTISEVKLFHLRAPRRSDTNGLKVQKIEGPSSLTTHGSKLLQFSPDMKWLLVVRNDNSVYVYRAICSTDSKSKPELLEKAVELLRPPRSYATLKVRSGTHGAYNRSIIKAAWSGDSHMLVVGDLSGNLDSWVLEGYEDLTLVDHQAIQTTERIPTSDDDDDDDDNTDEESQPTIIFGQHWIRNPQAAGLPKLPSFPLVLSFRPARSPRPPTLSNGHATVHPTRHSPYPHSHDLPNGEDRLLVVTSLHQVHEFHILAGRLSDWSRRNPPGGLPHEFKAIRDRTMDCVWDIRGDRERVWLYGTSWLWMFDLSKDFPIEHCPSAEGSQPNVDSSQLTHTDRKRKRYLRRQEKMNLMKNSTGAGSKIPDEEVNVGVGNKIRKTIGPEQGDSQWISLETRETRSRDEDVEDYDSDEASKGMSSLIRLRRASAGNLHGRGHDGGDEVINGESSGHGDGTAEREAIEGPAYWHTYKYRPILGIVTLDHEAITDDDVATAGGNVDTPGPGVEVALVERPMWDLDVPPRYHGDQEWET